MTGSFEELDHRVVHAYLRMMRQIPSYEYFSDLQVPTRLFIGERTFQAVKDSVELWRGIWPDVDVHTIDAAHLPIQEATEELARLIFAPHNA